MPLANNSQKLDLKIQATGRGRNLAVGKTLPRSWEYVRVQTTNHKDGSVSLHIRPLTLTEGD